MKKINIAIIYAGEHANRNILPILSESKKFNLKGIFIRSKKNFSLKYKKYYKKKREILNDKKIDTIYISSPNSIHYKNVIDCLKKNKNVISEKPLCINLNEYKKIKILSNKKNKIVFEAFMFVYHDIFQYFIQLIKNKKKANVIIDLKFLIPKRNIDDVRYKKSLGGGAFYDCGCYLFKFLSTIINYKDTGLVSPKFKFSKIHKIDNYGKLNFKKNSWKIKLEWGIGFKYLNKIKISYKDTKLVADRFFSKNFLENSIVKKISKKKKHIELKKFKKQNHFFQMFDYYYKLRNNNELKRRYAVELENHQKVYLNKIPYKL